MCPFTSQKCPFVPELIFFFPKVPFRFLEFLFCFPEVSFFPQNCFFNSQKHPLVFEKCLLLIHCASLLPVMLFSSWFTFSSCSELLREIIFALLLLFPFGTLYWPTNDASLITLKTLHGVWFFYVFYSNFSLHNCLENALSEHLEWVKF